MCGICGVWEYGASEGSVETSLITAMRDEMTHRGPDDSGEHQLRVVRAGQLQALDEAWRLHQETQPRVLPASWTR